MTADPSAARIVDLYREGAEDWIAARVELAEEERPWIDRFIAALPPGGSVLDVGCGSGRPIADLLIAEGFRVTGVDASARLLDHARARLPQGEWIEADMRTMDLGRRFDGVLAWSSLFHLSPEDQRQTLPRLTAHAAGVLMFNAGHACETRLGQWRSEPLHHASLDPGEYADILRRGGLAPETASGGVMGSRDGKVWLARRMKAS